MITLNELLVLSKCQRMCFLTNKKQAPMALAYVNLAARKKMSSISGVIFYTHLIEKLQKLLKDGE